MRVIAITNQKGGSGKTTTSVNLAATLAEKQRHILLIDLDPQASASNWYGIKEVGRGLLDMFTGERSLESLVQPSGVDNVEIVPSSAWLVGVEKALAGEVGAETMIRRNLNGSSVKRWDYVLMDCPPTLGILTVNALASAGEVIIPVEAHIMALSGLTQLLRTINVVKERINTDLNIAGILACRVDGRTRHSQEIVQELKGKFGNLVYNTIIRENVRLAESPSFGQPITKYDTRSSGAQDYRSLADEVILQEKRS